MRKRAILISCGILAAFSFGPLAWSKAEYAAYERGREDGSKLGAYQATSLIMGKLEKACVKQHDDNACRAWVVVYEQWRVIK